MNNFISFHFLFLFRTWSLITEHI